MRKNWHFLAFQYFALFFYMDYIKILNEYILNFEIIDNAKVDISSAISYFTLKF